MNADFFENATVHHAHYAAAAVATSRGIVGACPRRHDELARRIAAMRRQFRKARFELFECRDDVVSQVLEPGARGRFFFFQWRFGCVHGDFCTVSCF